MRSVISQREAYRLKKRVEELEGILRQQRNAYVHEWPSSVVIARLIPSDIVMAQISTARKLEHAVVAVPERNEIAFFAAKIPRSTR